MMERGKGMRNDVRWLEAKLEEHWLRRVERKAMWVGEDCGIEVSGEEKRGGNDVRIKFQKGKIENSVCSSRGIKQLRLGELDCMCTLVGRQIN